MTKQKKLSNCCNAEVTTKLAVEYAEGYKLTEIEKIGRTNYNICLCCSQPCSIGGNQKKLSEKQVLEKAVDSANKEQGDESYAKGFGDGKKEILEELKKTRRMYIKMAKEDVEEDKIIDDTIVAILTELVKDLKK